MFQREGSQAKLLNSVEGNIHKGWKGGIKGI